MGMPACSSREHKVKLHYSQYVDITDKLNKMDVFGIAFRDYMAGNRDGVIRVHSNIAEPEDLPVAYFFRSWDAMPEWEKTMMNQAAGHVMDVGAGAGSHALELQKRGVPVDAVDVSRGAAEVMRKRGVKHVYCADFFDIQFNHYDTILFLMNGVGIAGTLDGLYKLLQHAASMLMPGGEIIIESTDLMYMYEDADGSYRIPMGDQYYGELEYRLHYKNIVSEPFPWLFVDPESLKHAAEAAGLQMRILYVGENYNYVAALGLVPNGQDR